MKNCKFLTKQFFIIAFQRQRYIHEILFTPSLGTDLADVSQNGTTPPDILVADQCPVMIQLWGETIICELSMPFEKNTITAQEKKRNKYASLSTPAECWLQHLFFVFRRWISATDHKKHPGTKIPPLHTKLDIKQQKLIPTARQLAVPSSSCIYASRRDPEWFSLKLSIFNF